MYVVCYVVHVCVLCGVCLYVLFLCVRYALCECYGTCVRRALLFYVIFVMYVCTRVIYVCMYVMYVNMYVCMLCMEFMVCTHVMFSMQVTVCAYGCMCARMRVCMLPSCVCVCMLCTYVCMYASSAYYVCKVCV